MLLKPCSDPGPFEWIARSEKPWQRLVRLGPDGFEAYARLRYVPDPEWPGQREADVEMPWDHPRDTDQVGRALHVLVGFTATPEDCFFCAWEGFPDIAADSELRDHLVEVPNRRYVLLRGPLDAIDRWSAELGSDYPAQRPAFVWPNDRAWCLASDVDPHDAGIGGSHAAVAALLAAPGLDVVPTDPTADQPYYR